MQEDILDKVIDHLTTRLAATLQEWSEITGIDREVVITSAGVQIMNLDSSQEE